MNLVLIGLPGSGKTTVGQAAAQRLQMEFADLDCAVEQAAGMSVPDLFAAEGEQGFRSRESACLHKLLRGDNQVIATGGGAVLREENRIAMKAAAVVFLDREPEDIMFTFDAAHRPLMATHSLEELSRRRRKLYLAAADVIIREKTAEEAVNAIAIWWRKQL